MATAKKAKPPKKKGGTEQQASTDQSQPLDKPFKCPDCPAQYDRPTGLGVHRRHVHGVLGTSPAAVALRKQAAEQKKGAGRRGKDTGAKTQGGSIQKARRGEIIHNGHAEAVNEPPPYRIPEGTVAVAYGRIVQFQQSLAIELGVCFQDLVRELAPLITRTAATVR